MKKLIKQENVYYEEYFDEEMELDKFLEIINDAKSKGATHISIESDGDKYCASVRLFYDRKETDDEYQQRISWESKLEKQREDNERQTYEKLKKKFG